MIIIAAYFLYVFMILAFFITAFADSDHSYITNRGAEPE